ncbi:MAG TPA: polymer-forming cytoskeletal protein [Anaerolineae bacterium]|nr:polymer-forming cytoskeletal protein [Anaerolineae bacterium]
MRKKGLWLGLMVLLLLLPTSFVFADDPGMGFDGGRIFVDEDVSLESGESFSGDLGVFNGDLTVPQGSTVTGDVFVTNGDAEIGGQVNGSVAVISGDLALAQSGLVKGDAFVMSGDEEIVGHVEGDVSVMFGNIELRSTAIVDGNVVVLSGSLDREAGAQVRGQEMLEIPLPFLPERTVLPEIPAVPERPEIPAAPELPERIPVPQPRVRISPETPAQQFGRFVGRVLGAGFFSLVFVALGVLIVFVWPRPTHRVADCIAAMPVQSFVLGLATFLIALVLEALAMVLMILIILVAAALISTVILIPIGLLLILLSVLVLLPVPLALIGGMVLGWVSLAELVGRGVIKLLKAGYVRPLGATLVGLLVTVPIAAILWVAKPVCCAWPFIILLTSVGLGAVFHTRFGTQSCRQPKPSAEPDLLPPAAMDEEVGKPDVPPGDTP